MSAIDLSLYIQAVNQHI